MPPFGTAHNAPPRCGTDSSPDERSTDCKCGPFSCSQTRHNESGRSKFVVNVKAEECAPWSRQGTSWTQPLVSTCGLPVGFNRLPSLSRVIRCPALAIRPHGPISRNSSDACRAIRRGAEPWPFWPPRGTEAPAPHCTAPGYPRSNVHRPTTNDQRPTTNDPRPARPVSSATRSPAAIPYTP
jgi:hypothetical protein